MRLLSYNIRHGGVGREDAIGDVILETSPDLVVLQEATQPDVVAGLARRTGMIEWGARQGESLGFLSRWPLAHIEWHKPRVSRHAFLELVPEGRPWRLFGVHLAAVHAAWTEHRRVFEMRALLAAIARHQPGPHVLAGDFNTVAPGAVFDPGKLPHRLRALVWLSGGRIRWRTIQTVFDAGYIDGFRYRHPDEVGDTFPTWNPHVRLDYVFVPARYAESVRSCTVVNCARAQQASDHFPLFAELDA